MRAAAYSTAEITLAVLVAFGIQLAFFGLLVMAGANRGHVAVVEEKAAREVPIAVTPILDDLPLLKLGGKKAKNKLPDIWKKNPPVQRFEEASAPSAQADKSPEALPTSKVAERDATAPPPDAEVAKEVDQELLDAGPDAEPTVEGEGSPDGVEEGTETDPLKARAVSQYLMKIMSWFNARFKQPEIECEVLENLSASVAANVGGERAVTGFSVLRPSGNPVFDEQVRSTMQAIVGQQLPPPPPLYPDILEQTVTPRFQGKCQR